MALTRRVRDRSRLSNDGDKNCPASDQCHRLKPGSSYRVQSHQLLGMDVVMTRTSDLKWIVAHSTLATLLLLAWAYIPA
jgi:hypothetical protein